MRLPNSLLAPIARLPVWQIILSICIGWLSACGVEELPVPILEEICLSNDKSNCIKHAKNDVVIEIELRGKNFFTPYELSLDNREPPSPFGEYKAWIGSHPIMQLSQKPIKIEDKQALSGLLPALLSPGLYDAKLTLPSGQEITLPEAFRIVGP